MIRFDDRELEEMYSAGVDEAEIRTARFKGLPWFDIAKESEVTVGGVGGIGSFLTFFLTRARMNVVAFDYDTIEVHNLGGQMFRMGSEGNNKVDEAIAVAEIFGGKDLIEAKGKFVKGEYVSEICVAAFDKIPVRAEMYHTWKDMVDGMNPETRSQCLFVDGRMGAEHMQIRVIRGDASDKMRALYEKSFEDFDDAEDEHGNETHALPCTQRATSHLGCICATHIMGVICNHLTNMNEDWLVKREMPTLIEIDLVSTHYQVFYDRYDN